MEVVRVDLNRGDFSEAISRAIKVLKFGGTVVYPTDTIYALGANALDELAIKKVFNIKNRSFSKPLPILARNMLWVENLARLNFRSREMLSKIWSDKKEEQSLGKVTVVLPQSEIIPDVLTANSKTIGIRISKLPFVDQLLKEFGFPLTSTSANISGENGFRSAEEIIKVFSGQFLKPSLVIDAGILTESDPSTVLDLTTHPPKILRVGPSKPEQLMKLLQI